MEEAWLITWDWQMEAAAVRDRFVNVLPINTSVEDVKRFVETVYSMRFYNADELLAMASSDWNPYKAELSTNGRIMCGRHPWLEARRVWNVRVEKDEETHYETIFWTERSVNGQEGECHIKRSKLGTLSFEDTWDRTTGKPKMFND